MFHILIQALWIKNKLRSPPAKLFIQKQNCIFEEFLSHRRANDEYKIMYDYHKDTYEYVSSRHMTHAYVSGKNWVLLCGSLVANLKWLFWKGGYNILTAVDSLCFVDFRTNWCHCAGDF